jgi:ketosteroid isomerase-like protein
MINAVSKNHGIDLNKIIHMKTNLFFICVTLSPMISFSQISLPDKITALNKEMEKAFNNNDMQKVATFYLDSAVILGGGMNLTGRTNIDNYWLSLKDKAASWKLEIDKIEDYDNIVIQRGRSYLSSGSGIQSNVRFILIWKKTGGSYKILYDSFTRL